MNDIRPVTTQASAAASKLAIADCDLHLGPAGLHELFPFLSQRWRDHIATYGAHHRTGGENGLPNYPKAQPMASRRDAWPPSGRPPGTDLDFTRTQHLDAHNVTLGLVNPPTPSNAPLNPGLGNALARAYNEWQLECLVRPEPRLRASLVVNYEDPVAAAAEIRHWAGNPGFGHVLLYGRTAAPMGSVGYLPIYEAAAETGIPVGVHAFGFGGAPNTAAGWGSFYLEDMVGHAQSIQAQLTSMILNGVFARLPKLRYVLIEGGFGWVPALAWRLDKAWRRLRSEVPDLTMAPSETIRSQVWFTTQPMEEPETRAQVLDTIGWIGWDRLLFASDYPHWDFDAPDQALAVAMTPAQRQGVMRDNALALYGAR
jgi:predicted TIM-barrel fold metal-dependent hydrolase